MHTAHRLPSAHDTVNTAAFDRHPHVGRACHARSRGAPPPRLPRRSNRHRQKSTLLLNLIAQDLAAGQGLALLDPHGDLAEAVLNYVPKVRTNDLVYINPADIERPIGFNPLSSVPHDLKPIVADGVVSAFRHVWPESWGPRLDYILTNAVRALLDVPGATLLMLPRLLIDERFRAHLIAQHVSDPVVRAFWVNEYASYSDSFRTEAISPIQNKIGKALIEPRLRNMLSQPKSTITFRRLMDEGAIVICNISKGALGESTAHLLGALLTTAFAQAALSRADTPAPERRVFHLYADEFQSFATESFALILSEARKYSLTLTIGHQYLDQLPDQLRAAVFGNAGSIIALPHRRGRRPDPRRADRPRQTRCPPRPPELHRLGTAAAKWRSHLPDPPRPP